MSGRKDTQTGANSKPLGRLAFIFYTIFHRFRRPRGMASDGDLISISLLVLDAAKTQGSVSLTRETRISAKEGTFSSSVECSIDTKFCVELEELLENDVQNQTSARNHVLKLGGQGMKKSSYLPFGLTWHWGGCKNRRKKYFTWFRWES